MQDTNIRPHSAFQCVFIFPFFYPGNNLTSPSCLSGSPPPLPEMKEKNPWHTPVTIIITVIGVIAIVTLVTVAVLQNKPLEQKYKVSRRGKVKYFSLLLVWEPSWITARSLFLNAAKYGVLSI